MICARCVMRVDAGLDCLQIPPGNDGVDQPVAAAVLKILVAKAQASNPDFSRGGKIAGEAIPQEDGSA
jgi:hypothetical protein